MDGIVGMAAFSMHVLFSPFQMGVGLISNLIVFPPLILAAILFKRGAVFRKRPNRIDKSVEIAIEDESFEPPEKSFTPNYPDEILKYGTLIEIYK